MKWAQPGLKYLPTALIAAFAFYIGLAITAETRSLQGVEWSRIGLATAVACLLSVANYLLRFWRWQLFLRRLGAHRPAAQSLLCYMAGFAFTLLPGKAGEMMRTRYYARLDVNVEQVGAAFVVERILDFGAVCLLCLLGVGALHGAFAYAGWLIMAIAAVAAIMLALTAIAGIVRKRMAAAQAANTVLASTDEPVRPSGLKARILAAYHHGRSLLQPQMFLPALAIGLFAWGLEGIGFWLLIKAADPGATMDIGASVSVYSLSLVAGAASFLPGGLGGTEATMLFLLKHNGVHEGTAYAVTLICRLATLWLAILLGWVAVGALALQSRRHGQRNGIGN